jgi:hypothetical protein
MTRFAVRQPDLFAAPSPAPPSTPDDPVAELNALLDCVRGATSLPWPDAVSVMAAEHRALGLAGRAGAAGEELLAAFLTETERLLALTD